MSHKSFFVIIIFCCIALPAVSQADASSQARMFFEEGIIHLENSKLGYDNALFSALDSFLKAVELNPRYSQAVLKLASVYYQLEEYERSLNFLQELERLGQNSSEIEILRGNIALAQGKLDIATESFTQALAISPNALDAYIGKAELALFKGNVIDAVQNYLQVLKRSPEHRKALLSLTIASSALSRFQDADQSIEQALRYHTRSPAVHETAAVYYMSRKDYKRAEFHARSAHTLNPTSPDTLSILVDVAVEQKKFSAAVDFASQLITLNPDNALSWYRHGYVAYLNNDNNTAVESFQRARAIESQNEVIQIALERTFVDMPNYSDQRRIQYAEQYLHTAQQFIRNHHTKDAENTLRRGLRLDPYSVDLRAELAALYSTKQEFSRSLQELIVLSSVTTDEISDIKARIESMSRVLADSVAFRWKIDQFSTVRSRYRIKVLYYNTHIFPEILPGTTQLFSWYSKELLQSKESLEILPESSAISSFSEAIRIARTENLHYFIIIDYQHSEHSFLSAATLYTASGAKQASSTSLRAGTNRVRYSLENVLSEVIMSLPRRGLILKRNRDKVLVTLGTRDGIQKGDLLSVLEQGSLTLQPTEPGFSYKEEKEVGSIRVSEVDELVAEGMFTSKTTVDRLQTGDDVVYLQTDASNTVQGRVSQSFVLPQPIFSIVRALP